MSSNIDIQNKIFRKIVYLRIHCIFEMTFGANWALLITETFKNVFCPDIGGYQPTMKGVLCLKNLSLCQALVYNMQMGLNWTTV